MSADNLPGPVTGSDGRGIIPPAGPEGANPAVCLCASFRRYGLLAALLTFAANAAADPLTEPLTAFMRQQYTTPPASLEVVIKTPAAQQPTCGQPQFSLPSSNRIWGNISVAVVCGTQKRFIQAEVRITDRYLVAARPIAADQTVSADDLAWRTGRLDRLSAVPLMDMDQAVGSISERSLGSGQPLTAAMLRRPWLVKMGQPVQVSARGTGFAVQSTGKAMNNAAVNDPLRVRMDSGQIVTGRLMADGTVHVVL